MAENGWRRDAVGAKRIGKLRPKIESVEYCIKVRSKAGIHTIAFSKTLSISLQQTERWN